MCCVFEVQACSESFFLNKIWPLLFSPAGVYLIGAPSNVIFPLCQDVPVCRTTVDFRKRFTRIADILANRNGRLPLVFRSRGEITWCGSHQWHHEDRLACCTGCFVHCWCSWCVCCSLSDVCSFDNSWIKVDQWISLLWRFVEELVPKAGPESAPHSGTNSGDISMCGNTNRLRFPVPISEPQNEEKIRFVIQF